jgi:transposase
LHEAKLLAACAFGVGVCSVKRYVAAYRQGRLLALKKRLGFRPKMDEGARRLLEAAVEERPAATLSERREFLERIAWVQGSLSRSRRISFIREV